MATHTEKILCKFCPKSVIRFFADSTPRTDSRFFLLKSHYKEDHPIEYQRIMHYLDQEIIVQEEARDGLTVAKER
jgi:hypothetical protein